MRLRLISGHDEIDCRPKCIGKQNSALSVPMGLSGRPTEERVQVNQNVCANAVVLNDIRGLTIDLSTCQVFSSPVWVYGVLRTFFYRIKRVRFFGRETSGWAVTSADTNFGVIRHAR